MGSYPRVSRWRRPSSGAPPAPAASTASGPSAPARCSSRARCSPRGRRGAPRPRTRRGWGDGAAAEREVEAWPPECCSPARSMTTPWRGVHRRSDSARQASEREMCACGVCACLEAARARGSAAARASRLVCVAREWRGEEGCRGRLSRMKVAWALPPQLVSRLQQAAAGLGHRAGNPTARARKAQEGRGAAAQAIARCGCDHGQPLGEGGLGRRGARTRRMRKRRRGKRRGLTPSPPQRRAGAQAGAAGRVGRQQPWRPLWCWAGSATSTRCTTSPCRPRPSPLPRSRPAPTCWPSASPPPPPSIGGAPPPSRSSASSGPAPPTTTGRRCWSASSRLARGTPCAGGACVGGKEGGAPRMAPLTHACTLPRRHARTPHTA